MPRKISNTERRAAYLADKCCVKCGSTTKLEIDHINPITKVSHRIWSWSETRLALELVKCQVLCYPCHVLKTRNELHVAPEHGLTAYQQGCRCRQCKDAHAADQRRYRAGEPAPSRQRRKH